MSKNGDIVSPIPSPSSTSAEFAAIPAERYPYLVANVGVLMTGGSDERFAFGIDMLIAGFAAQIDGAQISSHQLATVSSTFWNSLTLE